jgi:integrase
LLSTASEDWLKSRTGIAPATERSYRLAISQLTTDFGKRLLCDISGENVAAFQGRRRRDGVSNRTINLEMGVLRAILRRNRMWEAVAQDIDFLKEAPSPGRALSTEEETRLLDAASKSRCRSLYPVILLAINTGMRANEIRLLTWGQVDFLAKSLIVGKSKTEFGTGRVIPLNLRAIAMLTHWRGLFANAQPNDFVFPSEKYGFAGNDRKLCSYAINPSTPMQRWKVGWESARKAAKVSCRFHDLRHTFISRLAESQVSDSTVMALAGHVSRAMMERYSHIRMEAKRRAVNDLSGIEFEPGWAQNRAQFFLSEKSDEGKSLKRLGEPGRTRTSNPLIKSQLLYH